jgi:hypothetical protein
VVLRHFLTEFCVDLRFLNIQNNKMSKREIRAIREICTVRKMQRPLCDKAT